MATMKYVHPNTNQHQHPPQQLNLPLVLGVSVCENTQLHRCREVGEKGPGLRSFHSLLQTLSKQPSYREDVLQNGGGWGGLTALERRGDHPRHFVCVQDRFAHEAIFLERLQKRVRVHRKNVLGN